MFFNYAVSSWGVFHFLEISIPWEFWGTIVPCVVYLGKGWVNLADFDLTCQRREKANLSPYGNHSDGCHLDSCYGCIIPLLCIHLKSMHKVSAYFCLQLVCVPWTKSNCFNLEWDQTWAYQSTHDMNSCMAQDENLAWCFSIEDIGRKKKKTCWNKTSSNLYWYRNVTINLILPTQSGNATATSLSKNLFCILSKDLSCISPFC